MGYKYSTRAAMTVSISDMTVPPQKPEMIKKAQATVDQIAKHYKMVGSPMRSVTTRLSRLGKQLIRS